MIHIMIAIRQTPWENAAVMLLTLYCTCQRSAHSILCRASCAAHVRTPLDSYIDFFEIDEVRILTRIKCPPPPTMLHGDAH
jgi:hypothetical protein